MSERNETDMDLRVAYLDPTARLFGKVSIGEGSSLWPYVVIRAETFEVRIGRNTNIQDFVMIHVGYETPTIIGDNCSVTHHCTLHGCTLGDNCLVGIGATVMDRCVIGDNCIIGAQSLLVEGTVIPDNSVVMGAPAKVVRQRDNRVDNLLNARLYRINAEAYARGEHRAWQDPDFVALMARERKAIEDEIQ